MVDCTNTKNSTIWTPWDRRSEVALFHELNKLFLGEREGAVYVPDKLRSYLSSCQDSLVMAEVREEEVEVPKTINCVSSPSLTA
jgi:hypothetical protein